jgi:hypothetical protein
MTDRIEKVDRGITLASQIGAAFIAGYMLSSALHETRKADKAVVALPQVQAEAGCEHWRASVTTKLALQTQMVDPKAIPKDCPHAALPKK